MMFGFTHMNGICVNNNGIWNNNEILMNGICVNNNCIYYCFYPY